METSAFRLVGSDVLEKLRQQERGQRLVLDLGIFSSLTMLSIAIWLTLMLELHTLHLALDIGLLPYIGIGAGAGIFLATMIRQSINHHFIPIATRDCMMSIEYTDALPQLMEHAAPWELLQIPAWQFWHRVQRPRSESLADRLNWIAWQWQALLEALGYRLLPSIPGWITQLVIATLIATSLYLVSASYLVGLEIGFGPLAILAGVGRSIRHIAALAAIQEYFSGGGSTAPVNPVVQ